MNRGVLVQICKKTYIFEIWIHLTLNDTFAIGLPSCDCIHAEGCVYLVSSTGVHISYCKISFNHFFVTKLGDKQFKMEKALGRHNQKVTSCHIKGYVRTDI